MLLITVIRCSAPWVFRGLELEGFVRNIALECFELPWAILPAAGAGVVADRELLARELRCNASEVLCLIIFRIYIYMCVCVHICSKFKQNIA